MKWLLVISIGVGAVLSAAFFVASASAHQSGCHRWHSCPSDSGSYNCGDWGYTSGCGYGTYTPAPQYKTYSWRGITYIDYNTYRQKRWDDIQALYKALLGRYFYNQEEGNIYTDSDKSYDDIKNEIIGSEERKNYLAIQSKITKSTPITGPTSVDTPVTQSSSSDWSWLWWLLGMGYVGYIIHEHVKCKN